MSRKLYRIALCTMLLGQPLSAQAQQPTKIPRAGYLGATSPAATAARMDAFKQGVRELGYVEGRTIIIDYRWAEGKLDLL
jgi:putative ABC transport system substrate-binding protein